MGRNSGGRKKRDQWSSRTRRRVDRVGRRRPMSAQPRCRWWRACAVVTVAGSNGLGTEGRKRFPQQFASAQDDGWQHGNGK